MMEGKTVSESSSDNPESIIPLAPAVFIPPSLRDGEHFHVFVSYSSTDYQWTHSLIRQLESVHLQVCFHERDFTPGRTVLENMSECIQESQKVLLVLSAEFVRSRWCLLEANMSLFRDCLERKPIIPVMLEPGVPIPLHLCHLTYLEVSDPDFTGKLLKVLCTPNGQLRGSTVVPFQPPSIYNGKALQPLNAVNEEGLHKWESGQFSDMEVPDQLRLVIEDKDMYAAAVKIINDVSEKVWFRPMWVRVLTYPCLLCLLIGTMFVNLYVIGTEYTGWFSVLVCLPGVAVMIQGFLWLSDSEKHILGELQKAVGRANLILGEQKVLMGCLSNSKMHLVYVSLDACRQEFAATFGEQGDPEEMFRRAVLFFSSGYACCLSKKYFTFPCPATGGHLERGVCFCQYVSKQLSRGEWK